MLSFHQYALVRCGSSLLHTAHVAFKVDNIPMEVTLWYAVARLIHQKLGVIWQTHFGRRLDIDG